LSWSEILGAILSPFERKLMFCGTSRGLFAVAVYIARTLQGDLITRHRTALLNRSRSWRYASTGLRDLLNVIAVSISDWTNHMLVASAATEESLADKIKVGNPW
jgi:hypothetical protein